MKLHRINPQDDSPVGRNVAMGEPLWLWASAVLVILNISLPARTENIRIHQELQVKATACEPPKITSIKLKTRSGPGKLKMIACELQCFFGANFILNVEIPMVYQAGAR